MIKDSNQHIFFLHTNGWYDVYNGWCNLHLYLPVSLSFMSNICSCFSDTGTFPPESCVFTLFLNCAAVVGMSKFTFINSVYSLVFELSNI